jgi:DNA-binding protein HU-beta
VYPLVWSPNSTLFSRSYAVNKSELVQQLASRADLTKAQASRVVDALFSVGPGGLIADALRSGDKVQITGFGSFEAKHREARTGRNPRTGKEIKIAASKSPAFRSGKGFKDALTGGES